MSEFSHFKVWDVYDDVRTICVENWVMLRRYGGADWGADAEVLIHCDRFLVVKRPGFHETLRVGERTYQPAEVAVLEVVGAPYRFDGRTTLQVREVGSREFGRRKKDLDDFVRRAQEVADEEGPLISVLDALGTAGTCPSEKWRSSREPSGYTLEDAAGAFEATKEILDDMGFDVRQQGGVDGVLGAVVDAARGFSPAPENPPDPAGISFDITEWGEGKVRVTARSSADQAPTGTRLFDDHRGREYNLAVAAAWAHALSDERGAAPGPWAARWDVPSYADLTPTYSRFNIVSASGEEIAVVGDRRASKGASSAANAALMAAAPDMLRTLQTILEHLAAGRPLPPRDDILNHLASVIAKADKNNAR